MSRVIYTPTLYLRLDKRKQNGNTPLYIRFQRINNKEPKFPLGIEVTQEAWDTKKQCPKDPALSLIVEKRLSKIKQQILNATMNDIEITHSLLKEFVEGKPKPDQRSFYEYFDEYLKYKQKKGLIGESTLKIYMTTYNSLKEFKRNITIQQIDENLILNFNKFLIKRGEQKGFGEVKGTRHNRLKHIRSIIHYIEKKGIPNKINKTLRKLANAAGINKHLTFHAGRRTFATNRANSGVDNYVLMKLMGHTNYQTTLQYSKWNQNIARGHVDDVEILKMKQLI